MSDERTLREDLIIREGSSPEAKKGILSKLKFSYDYFFFLYEKMQRILTMNYVLQKSDMIKVVHIKSHHILVEHRFFFNHLCQLFLKLEILLH